MKKKIKKYIQSIYGYDIEGSLNDFIDQLNKIKEENKNYEELIIEVDSGDDDQDCELLIYDSREETDEEYQKRLNLTEAHNKLQEEYEKKTLADLLKKYPIDKE